MSGVSINSGDIPSAGKLTVQTLEGVVSSSLALTSTLTDVAGGTVTMTAQTASAYYIATISARMDRTATASATNGLVRLDLDGSSVAGQLAISVNAANTGIWTIAKTWTGALAAGSHTFKIRASASISSIWTVTSADSNLVVTVYG